MQQHRRPPSGARGAIVRVKAWCENGQHRFAVVFEFYKGQTSVHTEVEAEPDDPPELWRD
ncbi:MAG: hypothetical protein HY690_05250 [Chloroflexi bacterium]|nr:hypothetical protein [Chloroflexota bacterium]